MDSGVFGIFYTGSRGLVGDSSWSDYSRNFILLWGFASEMDEVMKLRVCMYVSYTQFSLKDQSYLP